MKLICRRAQHECRPSVLPCPEPERSPSPCFLSSLASSTPPPVDALAGETPPPPVSFYSSLFFHSSLTSLSSLDMAVEFQPRRVMDALRRPRWNPSNHARIRHRADRIRRFSVPTSPAAHLWSPASPAAIGLLLVRALEQRDESQCPLGSR